MLCGNRQSKLQNLFFSNILVILKNIFCFPRLYLMIYPNKRNIPDFLLLIKTNLFFLLSQYKRWLFDLIILFFLIFKKDVILCLYHLFTWSIPIHLHNFHGIIYPSLSCLFFLKFFFDPAPCIYFLDAVYGFSVLAYCLSYNYLG